MRNLSLFITALFFSVQSNAESISVAVAGGFKPAMDQIKIEFEKQSNDQLLISYASVGSLFVQITQDAPFDVFISADVESPQKLEEMGIAVDGTRFPYCESKLVLWSPQAGLVDAKGEVLNSDKYQHLALANPKVGVHGKSAIEVLEKLKLYDAVKSRIVEGKNMLQTVQFMDTGVAELGFVSWSMIYRKGKEVQGSYWIIPEDDYSHIVQEAQLLQRGKDKPGAKKLLEFLGSHKGKEIMDNFGYKTF